MAKDGYRRPFRKWFAETAEGPLILLYGAAFGAVSGLSGGAIYSETMWDTSSVTTEQEKTFTTIIDQKFSDIEALQSQKSDILFSKQTAEFNDDFKLLEEFSKQETAINNNIASKSDHLAKKLITTPAISETVAQTYSDKFSNAGLNASSTYDLSEFNMKYRNECLNENNTDLCMTSATKKDTKHIAGATFGGGGILLVLSLLSLAIRSEGGFNRWAYMDNVPTLKTKIKNTLEQQKRPKLGN